MSKHLRCRLSLEQLEDRYTPAGNVTGSFANGTWTLVGDNLENDLLIKPAATPNAFTVTGLNNTTVSGVTNPTAVKNIVFKMLGGNDGVDLVSSGPVGKLAGHLTMEGGSEANDLYIKDFEIGGNVTVRNGTNTGGDDDFYLIDSIVKGSLVLNNGDGYTTADISRTKAGTSYIGKNLVITNGAGYDEIKVVDYHIGGHVVIQNGLPDAGKNAGEVRFYNFYNTTARSVVGGNVAIAYQGDGKVESEGIWDYDVKGNVTFNHANGEAATYFDGYKVNQPALIRGNLTIVDNGQSRIDIGREDLKLGLIVGKNLTIRTGSQSDTLVAHRLCVSGATLILTGSGADTVTIDDSSFLGRQGVSSPYGFQLQTGAGSDAVHIETDSQTTAHSQIVGPTLVDLGSDNDILRIGFGGDATRRLTLNYPSFFFGGPSQDTFYRLNVSSVLGFPITTVFETVIV